jgi:hypothetical protein
MKIDANNKMVLANKVLARIRKIIAHVKAEKIFFLDKNKKECSYYPQPWVEAYSNCREQGLCLRDMYFTAAWSENRNSDAIVVYIGDYHDFDMGGNIPNDNIYDTRKLFSPNDGSYLDDAAHYIVNCFIEYMKKEQEKFLKERKELAEGEKNEK